MYKPNQTDEEWGDTTTKENPDGTEELLFDGEAREEMGLDEDSENGHSNGGSSPEE